MKGQESVFVGGQEGVSIAGDCGLISQAYIMPGYSGITSTTLEADRMEEAD